MSITATAGNKTERELLPAGTHVARLYSIIHIGKLEEEYMGEPKVSDKVMLRFEIPGEMREFGDKGMLPMAISREYTLSIGEKSNLRPLIEGMTGKSLEEDGEFALLPLMGTVCLLSVIHKTSRSGAQYAQIVSASPLAKGMTAPEAINPPFIFDFEENWNEEELEKMPEFLRNKIKSSKQYAAKKGLADDQTPF